MELAILLPFKIYYSQFKYQNRLRIPTIDKMKTVNFISKNQLIKNKLFLTCPVSHMEPFIKERYGWDGYFLNAPGAVFSFQEISYSEALRDFLEIRAIREIFIVNDTSCPFINGILEGGNCYETKAEQVMQNLFIDNYFAIMDKTTLADRKVELATLNLERQALDIVSNDLLQPVLKRLQIKILGVLTTKEKGLLREVTINLQKNYK